MRSKCKVKVKVERTTNRISSSFSIPRVSTKLAKTEKRCFNKTKRYVLLLLPLLLFLLSTNPLQAQRRGEQALDAEPKLVVTEVEPVTPEAAMRYRHYFDLYMSRQATKQPTRTRVTLHPDLARVIDKQRTFLVGTPASDVRIVYGLKNCDNQKIDVSESLELEK